jgi:hypothetical protein
MSIRREAHGWSRKVILNRSGTEYELQRCSGAGTPILRRAGFGLSCKRGVPAVPVSQARENVSSYGPLELEALGKAFDIAWERIVPNISKRVVAMELARIVLANIVFGLARHGNFDPRWLADNAVALMLSHTSESRPQGRGFVRSSPASVRVRVGGMRRRARRGACRA